MRAVNLLTAGASIVVSAVWGNGLEVPLNVGSILSGGGFRVRRVEAEVR